MKKYFLLLILLFSTHITVASTVQYGEIRLEVINKPPTITQIKIIPEYPYYDDVLECRTEVDDESPLEVSYEYEWFVNEEKKETNSRFLLDFEEEDKITCVATPTDKLGLQGGSKSSSAKINAAPIHVKALKPTLNLAGIEVSAKEITESTSILAITGMATGYRESNSITLVFMLSVFTLILISINVFGLIITIKRKSKSPKQDYPRA